MRVVLFKATWSPLSKLISWVTKSNFAHAGVVLTNGHVVDANMVRGMVMSSGALVDFGSRGVSVWELASQEDAFRMQAWAMKMLGTKYDYSGVLGYLWGKNGERELYCFEFVIHAICAAKGWPRPARNRFTAWEVLGYLDALGAKMIYQGPAKNYT